jgi:8-oxo-dGTP pyrophosphatase MutT (NUDIX family)
MRWLKRKKYCVQSCYCFLMPERRLWPVSIKGVLFIDKKVVLLLNDRGEWELPGGRLEKGEPPEACLQREFNEELGCPVEVGELRASHRP